MALGWEVFILSLFLSLLPCWPAQGTASSDTYNNLKAVNPTQAFQPIVSSLGCASSYFVDGKRTFFVLHGSCFAGAHRQATWLYSVGPNTWYRNQPVFAATTGPPTRQDHSMGTLPDETGVLLFAGRSGSNSSAALFSDTWLFSAGNLQWKQITPTGLSPASRYSSSLVGCTISHECSGTSGLFVFGGLRTPQAYGDPPQMLGDLWSADVSKTTPTIQWQEIHATPDPVHGLPVARGRHQAAMGNATMYLCGGITYTGNDTSTVTFLMDLWKFNVRSRSWSRLTDLNATAVSGQSCFVSGLSFVPTEPGVTSTLIALLSCSSASEMDVWSYTIETDRWESVWYIKGDSLPPPFVQPIAQEHSEQVYIYGGIDSQSRVYTGLWVLRYNTDESTCVQAAAPDILPPIVSQHAAAFLPKTNALYVYGGVYPTTPALPGVEPTSLNLADHRLHVFDTAESMWTSIIRTGIPRLAGHSMMAVGSDLLVFGGFNPQGISQSALHKFNLATLTWNQTTVPSYTYKPRHSHAAAVDDKKQLMYVYGGLYSDLSGHVEVLGDLLVYDYAANNWKEMPVVGHRPPAVFGHSMVLIGDKLYVLGGAALNVSGSSITVFAVNDMIWSYSLTSHTWTNLCYLVTPQLYHPLLEGRFFTTASAKDLSLLMFVGDCCDAVCTITPSDLMAGVAFNSDDVAKKCCSGHNDLSSKSRVWLLSTAEQSWMELKMTYSASAHRSPIRHAGHSLTNINDAYLVHGGMCGTESDNTLCSLALPTYEIKPGCNAGSYSRDVSHSACQPCPAANFSSEAGCSECQACPLNSFSAQNGSTSQLQCSLCPRDMCNNAGDCSVDAASSGVQCSCDFGYDGDARCRVPTVFLGIGGAAIFIVVLLLITCLLVHKYRAKRHEDQEKERQLRTYKQEVSNLNSVWRIDAEELKLTQRIDGDTPGSFGEVWLAFYRDMQVAVKKLHTHVMIADSQALVEFQREAEFMRTIRHPNIVLFLGAGVMDPADSGKQHIPFLVVEYMSHGTVMSVLQDKTCHIDHQQRLRMALDVAKGMRFLHGLNPPRIHRDLKSANLLVSEHFVVKVSDFGSARWIHSVEESQQVSSLNRSTSSIESTPINSRTLSDDFKSPTDTDDPRMPLLSRVHPDALMSSDVGTLLWSAPEVLAQQAYGAGADVFSYGIVLWEMYSRTEPYSHTNFRFGFEFSKYIIEGGRPELDTSCPADFQQLFQQCWNALPEKRPKFTDVVPCLDNQLERCFSPS